jgi:hypothetical protein
MHGYPHGYDLTGHLVPSVEEPGYDFTFWVRDQTTWLGYELTDNHKIDWLIIYDFTSCWRIFHLYEDINITMITRERLQNLGLYARHSGSFEQGEIFIMPHLLWHGTSVFLVSSEGLPHSVASYDTHGGFEDLFQGSHWTKILCCNLAVCVLAYTIYSIHIIFASCTFNIEHTFFFKLISVFHLLIIFQSISNVAEQYCFLIISTYEVSLLHFLDFCCKIFQKITKCDKCNGQREPCYSNPDPHRVITIKEFKNNVKRTIL